MCYYLFTKIFQCSDGLQTSPLPEAAELIDLLNHIEFEGLFFAHDKLAERQVSHFKSAIFKSLFYISQFRFRDPHKKVQILSCLNMNSLFL